MGQRVRAFLENTQARMLPLTLIPLGLGGVLVWQREKLFHWGFFLGMVVGAVGMHLLTNRLEMKKWVFTPKQSRERAWLFLLWSLLLFCGAYAIQGGRLSWLVLWAALPVGVFATTVWHILDGQGLGQYVQKGSKKEGLLLAGSSLLIIITCIPLHVYPWYAVIAALTTPPALIILWQVQRDSKQYPRLVEATALAGMQSALLLLIALLIRGGLGI